MRLAPPGETAIAVPVAWSRSFPADAAQAGEARRFLAAILDGSPAAGEAVLCLSELVTNAIQASERLTTLETPVVRLWWPATINEASGGRNAGVIQTGGNAGVIHWSESSINEPLRSGRDLAGWYRALTHRVAFQARGEPCR